MHNKQYITGINQLGLDCRFSMLTTGGNLVWGICKVATECYILYNGMGHAHDGLYLLQEDKIFPGYITPSYNGKLLEEVPYADNGIPVIKDLKLADNGRPYSNGNIWGFGKQSDGRLLLFDPTMRVFAGPKLKENEVIDPKLIIPAYKGRILTRNDKFDIKPA